MSVIQECGAALAEWFWLRVSQKVAVRYGPRLESFEGLIGGGRSTSKLATHMAGGAHN